MMTGERAGVAWRSAGRGKERREAALTLLGSATDNERPRDMVRLLLECRRFLGSPSSISASPSAAREAERSRLRPRDSDRTRSIALLVSMPMAPSDFCSSGQGQNNTEE